MDIESKPRVYLVQRVKLTEKRCDKHFTWISPSSPPACSWKCSLLLDKATLHSPLEYCQHGLLLLPVKPGNLLFLADTGSDVSQWREFLLTVMRVFLHHPVWPVSWGSSTHRDLTLLWRKHLWFWIVHKERVTWNVFSDQQMWLWALGCLKNSREGVVAAGSF